MRYLGKVMEMLDQVLMYDKQTNRTVMKSEVKENEQASIGQLQMMGEFKHIKALLEKEVVVRCAKHVFNRILKEERGESDLFLADVVSHLLNCLLAPHDFLTRLDQGKLKHVDQSVQKDFEFRPGEIISSPRKNSNVNLE